MLTFYNTQNNYMVNSAEAEKPYLKGKVLPLLPARKMKTESMPTPQYILLALP